MDKVEQYKKIIQSELEERLPLRAVNAPKLTRQLMISDDKMQFVLMDVGWFKRRYLSDVIFHIGIVNNKVSIHNDFTDVGIADHLVDAGIPKSDIVLAFLPK
ncbi:MAG: element excision factor XisI family protein [Bacteroidota bacterium]